MAFGINLRRRLKLNAQEFFVSRGLLLDDLRGFFHQPVLHAAGIADDVIHLDQIEYV